MKAPRPVMLLAMLAFISCKTRSVSSTKSRASEDGGTVVFSAKSARLQWVMTGGVVPDPLNGRIWLGAICESEVREKRLAFTKTIEDGYNQIARLKAEIDVLQKNKPEMSYSTFDPAVQEYAKEYKKKDLELDHLNSSVKEATLSSDKLDAWEKEMKNGTVRLIQGFTTWLPNPYFLAQSIVKGPINNAPISEHLRYKPKSGCNIYIVGIDVQNDISDTFWNIGGIFIANMPDLGVRKFSVGDLTVSSDAAAVPVPKFSLDAINLELK